MRQAFAGFAASVVAGGFLAVSPLFGLGLFPRPAALVGAGSQYGVTDRVPWLVADSRWWSRELSQTASHAACSALPPLVSIAP